MLEVQKYLNKNSLEKLKEELGIDYKIHNSLPLVILDYSQIDSPKTHPIVQECRGLVLELDTWKIVAKGFNRFFNLGEALEITNCFNWDNFYAKTKEDGSYIMLYHYNGDWHVKTRNSFGDGKLQDTNLTWKELFLSTLKCDNWLRDFDKNSVGIFELCSIYNKIVRHYQEPQSYLLGVYNRHKNVIDQWDNDLSLYMFGVNTPREYKFYGKEDFLGFYVWIQSLSKTDIDQLSRVL